MAELASPKLEWEPAPGHREVSLPDPLPDVGDDFDWQLRDYDSFRRFMWEELQARFPERQRWTAADMEAVLVEVLATVLDQLSDMADRVASEASLETARRYESFYRWLRFIGFDAVKARADIADYDDLIALYSDKPQEMERDRTRAPGTIRRQKRMASLEDYARKLEEHPLVLRAQASQEWGGSWPMVWITVSLLDDWNLEARLNTKDHVLPAARMTETREFHERLELRERAWDGQPAVGELLRDYIRRYRMVGQEVILRDVVPVGIDIALGIHVHRNYFQSEVRREVDAVMGRGPRGFFRPGRLAFGQDLQLSDMYQRLMPLDGVDNVSLDRFHRMGKGKGGPPVDQSIRLRPGELAVSGRLEIELTGGRKG